MTSDIDILTDVTPDQLNSLATMKLSPADQARLDQLLFKSKEGTLTTSEASELNDLLARVDKLNLLKARAQYTLRIRSAEE